MIHGQGVEKTLTGRFKYGSKSSRPEDSISVCLLTSAHDPQRDPKKIANNVKT